MNLLLAQRYAEGKHFALRGLQRLEKLAETAVGPRAAYRSGDGIGPNR